MSHAEELIAAKADGAAAMDILDRDSALDGTRGFAICMLLCGHALFLYPSNPLTTMFQVIMDAMAISLDLFFILSGFLITSILIRTRDTKSYFRNFYARRVLRIFPAYYLVLTCIFIIRPLISTPVWHEQLIDSAPYYWLYVQNMVMAWQGEGLGWVGLFHTWSLAIEEQYYLLWPAVVWLIPRDRLLPVCLAMCGIGTLVMLWMAYAELSWWAVYMSTFSHSQGLAAGSALAAWIQSGRRTQPPVWFRSAGIASGAALVLIVLGQIFELFSKTWFHVLLAAAAVPFFSWMLFKLVTDGDTWLRRLLSSRHLNFMGRYSYGIYLIHFPVLWELRQAYLVQLRDALGLNAGIVLSGLIGVVISIALAVLMFHAVEQPMSRLKRYFMPKRSEVVVRINESRQSL